MHRITRSHGHQKGIHIDMQIEGVIVFNADSGVPLYSRLKSNIDPSLFSSFVSAARHFSNELELGGLSSFSTDEKVIFLAEREETITALIAPKTPEFEEILEVASVLGDHFERNYEITEMPQNGAYSAFSIFVDELLKEVEHPFLDRVARFVHDEYGGEISIKPRLIKRNGKEGVVDAMLSQANKSKYADMDKSESRINMFCDSISFVRAIDGIADKIDLMEFADQTDKFGIRVMNGDEMEFKPYFPSRAIVVAQEYDPSVFEYLQELTDKDGRKCIDGQDTVIEMWKWKEQGQPEKLS